MSSFYDEKFGSNYTSIPLTSHNIRLHNESYHNNNYQQEEEDKIRQMSRDLLGSPPPSSHTKKCSIKQTNRTGWLLFCSALLIVCLVLGKSEQTSRQTKMTSWNF